MILRSIASRYNAHKQYDQNCEKFYILVYNIEHQNGEQIEVLKSGLYFKAHRQRAGWFLRIFPFR